MSWHYDWKTVRKRFYGLTFIYWSDTRIFNSTSLLLDLKEKERLTLYDKPKEEKTRFGLVERWFTNKSLFDFGFARFNNIFASRQRIWRKETEFRLRNDCLFFKFYWFDSFVTRKRIFQLIFVLWNIVYMNRVLNNYSLICIDEKQRKRYWT